MVNGVNTEPPIAVVAEWKVFVYANDHGVPHIHIRNTSQSIPVAIMDGRVLEGNLPSNIQRVLVQWVEQHRYEAMDAWNRVKEGRLPKWID